MTLTDVFTCKNCLTQGKVSKVGHHEEDETKTVCLTCGDILDDSNLVSTIEFSENKNGTSSVVGHFVSAASTTRFGQAAESATTSNSHARETTVEQGRKRMEAMATALRVEPSIVRIATHLHMMALDYGFVKGRKVDYVYAVCLYTACRLQNQSQMLIDFSEHLNCNLFVLGQVFLKFAKRLEMNLPIIDPAIYVRRFAGALEFGDKLESVVSTTLRIVARMQRDWIVQGRRPTSVCGAALLIAARMHNFKRTKREVVSLLKICDTTLQLRLEEFQRTPSSKLTIEEFWAYDLPEETDPPAFAKQHGLIEDAAASVLVDAAREADILHTKLDRNEIDDETEVGSAMITLSSSSSAQPPTSAAHASLPAKPPPSSRRSSTTTTTTGKRRQQTHQAYTEIEDDLEEAFAVKVQGRALVEKNPASTELLLVPVYVPTPASLPAQSARERAEQRRKRDGILEVRHTLSDYEDDAEILSCLLTAEQRQRKEKAWDMVNKKYLERYPMLTNPAAKGVLQPVKPEKPHVEDKTRTHKKKKLSAPPPVPDTAPAPPNVLQDSLAASVRLGPRFAAQVEGGTRLDMSAAKKQLFG